MSVTFKGKEVKAGDVLFRATVLGVSEDKIKKLGPKTVKVIHGDAPAASRYHLENYFSPDKRNLFWDKPEADAMIKFFDLSVIFNEIKGIVREKIYAGKMNEDTIAQVVEKAEEIFSSLKSGSLKQ